MDDDDGPRGGACPYSSVGGISGANERHHDALRRYSKSRAYRHSDRRRGLTVLAIIGIAVVILATHAVFGGPSSDPRDEYGAGTGADNDRPLVTDGHHADGDDTLRKPEARGYQPGPPPGAAPGR